MKKLNILLISLGLTFGGTAVMANPPAYEQPAPPGMAPATEVSDKKLDKFAEIYVDVESTRSRLAAELSTAEDQQQAQELQMKMRDEIIATIEDHGWTLDDYNQVAQVIAADQQLKEKALEKINEHSS